jgi:hypothetical protein
MTDVPLQDGAFYARRFILSSCMNWNDFLFLRSDGSKVSSWRKAQRTQGRIHPQSWKLEFSNSKDAWEKSQVQSVTLEETKDAENKTYYVQINFKKGDCVALSSASGKRDIVSQFYCALMYLLDTPPNHPLVTQKTQEFQVIVTSAKQFLAQGPIETALPPVPPLPPNLDFVTPLPVNPT